MTGPGSPCPPWCARNHDRTGSHTTSRTAIDLPGYSGYLSTCAGEFGCPPEVVVHSVCREPGGPVVQGDMYLELAQAGELAAIIENLAHATPDQHRELAAAIRQAAAAITEAAQ